MYLFKNIFISVSSNSFNLTRSIAELLGWVMVPESLMARHWGWRWTLGHMVHMPSLAPGISAASQPHFKAWSHTPASTILLGI